MNKKLKNFNDLFSENDQIVYKALLAKKDWLFVPLFLKGNLEVNLDENGNKHYRFLEALYDDVLAFDEIVLDKKLPLKPRLKSKIEMKLTPYVKLTLLDSIPDDESPFFAEYDFTKINDETYHSLLANFYPCFPLRTLDINLLTLESSRSEQLKCVMIGKKCEYVLIVDRFTLINNCLYAPILRAIHVRPTADPLLKEELQILCKEKGIIYKEVLYD